MAFGWVIDPSASEIDLNASPYTIIEASFPPGDVTPAYSTSQAMEGERVAGLHYANRKVQIRVAVEGSSQSDLEDKIADLTMKCGKIQRDAVVGGTGYGGTLKYTAPTDNSYTLYACSARAEVETGFTYVHSTTTNVTLDFECAPFGYGSEQTLSDHVETTAPCLVFTEASIPGDVPALGRLVVDEDQGASQSWAVWGLRSKHYSSDATAGLYYAAESLTPLGAGATTSTAASGYTGTGSILAGSLSTSYEAILSSQASGGGAHWTHTGAYRVFARTYVGASNVGVVSLALEWASGDFRRPSRNASVTTNGWAGKWRLADLGIVNVPTDSTRFEARVLAKSTVLNDDVHLDWLMLVPCDEASGEVTGQVSSAASTGYTARDDFSSGTYSGDLAADTLPTGGTWGTTSSPYETTDYAVSGGTLRRSATSDTNTDVRYGRLMFPSATSAMTQTAVQVTLVSTGPVSGAHIGVVARVVDKDNFLLASITLSGSSYVLGVYKVVSGTATTLSTDSFLQSAMPGNATMLLTVSSAGAYTASILSEGVALLAETSGYDSTLATSGALDDGYCGVYDWWPTATAVTRQYDDFYAWVPVLDAACFASQSMRVTNNTAEREDSSGTFWTQVSRYEGDYLLVPASGKESRTVEFIVKMSRNDPDSGADTATDDLSARLYVRPRFLQLPT